MEKLTYSEVWDAVEKGVLKELDMISDEAPYGWDDRLNRAITNATQEIMKLQEETPDNVR